MFMFYEVALIIYVPPYREYAWGSYETDSDADGRFRLLIIGILGSLLLVEPPMMNVVLQPHAQYPSFTFRRYSSRLYLSVLGVLRTLPIPTWSPDGQCFSPTAVSMLHAGVLMKLGGYGCFRIAMYLMPEAAHQLAWIFIIPPPSLLFHGAFGMCTDRPSRYQRLFICVTRTRSVALLMMTQTSCTGAILQMLSRTDDSPLLRPSSVWYTDVPTHVMYASWADWWRLCRPWGWRDSRSLAVPRTLVSGFVAEMTIFVGSFSNTDIPPHSYDYSLAEYRHHRSLYSMLSVRSCIEKVADPAYEKLTDATWDERCCMLPDILGSRFRYSTFMGQAVISDTLGPILGQVSMAGWWESNEN